MNTRGTKKSFVNKGSVTLRALEILENIRCGADDIFFVFSLPYGTPLIKALTELEWRKEKRDFRLQTLGERGKLRRQVHNVLYQLRKDNLITGSSQKSFALTRKGMEKLAELRNRWPQILLQSKYKAPSSNSSIWHIIIYDIPEHQRHKRHWLRAALNSFDFKMLQKKVFGSVRKNTRAIS